MHIGFWLFLLVRDFTATPEGGPGCGNAILELCWLDAQRHAELFFHACHAWAATREKPLLVPGG